MVKPVLSVCVLITVVHGLRHIHITPIPMGHGRPKYNVRTHRSANDIASDPTNISLGARLGFLLGIRSGAFEVKLSTTGRVPETHDRTELRYCGPCPDPFVPSDWSPILLIRPRIARHGMFVCYTAFTTFRHGLPEM